MRISLAALADYPFPTASFTLLNGRVIDPTVDTPAPGSFATGSPDCVPYQCGADPSNQAARMWCSYNGQVGSRPCTDPACAPFLSQIPACTLPQIPATPAPVIPTLTPANIVQPLPDITQTLMPQPMTVPDCSLWCVLNGAIAANPLVATIVLAGVAFAIWKGSKR